MFVSLPFPRHPMHRRLDDVPSGPISTGRQKIPQRRYSRSVPGDKKRTGRPRIGHSPNLWNRAPKGSSTPRSIALSGQRRTWQILSITLKEICPASPRTSSGYGSASTRPALPRPLSKGQLSCGGIGPRIPRYAGLRGSSPGCLRRLIAVCSRSSIEIISAEQRPKGRDCSRCRPDPGGWRDACNVGSSPIFGV